MIAETAVTTARLKPWLSALFRPRIPSGNGRLDIRFSVFGFIAAIGAAAVLRFGRSLKGFAGLVADYADHLSLCSVR